MNPSEKASRLLIVVSNFGHLKATLIPSMVTQLERAFNTSIDADRKVMSLMFCHHGLPFLMESVNVEDFDDGRARTGQVII